MSPKTVRTTISLPAELKERMDAVAGEVNWSAVAAQAFEERLAQIAVKKEGATMDDVVNRLKTSAQRSDERRYPEGKQAGRKWAEQEAEAEQLENLAEFLALLDTATDGRVRFFRGHTQGRYRPAARLYFVINPEDDGQLLEASAFWDDVLGNDARKSKNAAYLWGFCEGAEEVWNEVKDQL